MRRVRSSTSTLLMRMPSSAPRPTPTMMAVGVASPSAHGQAMISTATAATSPLTATRMAAVIWSGGKGRPGDYLAADDPQASDERQPVGVQVRFEGGGVHHLTQGVVDQQVRPDLLGDQLGALGAQHLPGATLGRLQLPKRGLHL